MDVIVGINRVAKFWIYTRINLNIRYQVLDHRIEYLIFKKLSKTYIRNIFRTYNKK